MYDILGWRGIKTEIQYLPQFQYIYIISCKSFQSRSNLSLEKAAVFFPTPCITFTTPTVSERCTELLMRKLLKNVEHVQCFSSTRQIQVTSWEMNHLYVIALVVAY